MATRLRRLFISQSLVLFTRPELLLFQSEGSALGFSGWPSQK